MRWFYTIFFPKRMDRTPTTNRYIHSSVHRSVSSCESQLNTLTVSPLLKIARVPLSFVKVFGRAVPCGKHLSIPSAAQCQTKPLPLPFIYELCFSFVIMRTIPRETEVERERTMITIEVRVFHVSLSIAVRPIQHEIVRCSRISIRVCCVFYIRSTSIPLIPRFVRTEYREKSFTEQYSM